MLLARTVAHTVDVDAMLANMTPQQFDEWATMYAIRPWGIELPTEEKADGGGSLDVFRGMAGF